MKQSQFEEDAAYEEACKRLLFSDLVRTILVMVSLLTLLPIGIIAIVFWIVAKKAWNQGRKKRAADNYHEAETMAMASISFGLLALLTILICIPQLQRGILS